MKKRFCYLSLMMLAVIFALSAVSICHAAENTKEKEAMQQKTAPRAAMLPILSSNDPVTANFITDQLVNCLAERKVFSFANKDNVQKSVAAGGYDLTKIFGLSTDEYKALGKTLEADYLLHGIIAIRKSLKFTGWRRDVDVYIKLYDGKTGESIESWRSMTDFTWTDAATEKDTEKMAEAVVKHICGKMKDSGY
ncbi:MAG TPA: hypothetical protein PKZ12_08400 [Smithellaceae bacterium]|nr:hypothetical protein [Smithellaceae bacterium]